MVHEIVCTNRDGFRVDTGYFERKSRFQPGICPRDGAPVEVVEAGTYTKVEGVSVSLVTGSLEGTAE
tara:strand:+ start:2104 stop:2304 length:201 start_codon:yes stop_codon:yes gene_type:complete